MKSLLRLAFSALLLCGLCSPALAQLSGTISVPTATYPTLDSVVKLLNAQGVGTGGLTVNLTAAQTAPTGGYQIGSAVLNASLSAARPLTINGGNNTILGQTGTTAFDLVFALLGTDYLTLNGLNIIATSGATPAARVEIGIGLLKLNGAAPYDGCQFVTVSNCGIMLTNDGGTGINARHSYIVRDTTYNAVLTGATASDANSNNTFKGNTITGMTQGIVLSGMNVTNAWDYNNTIGGVLPADGNTITNGPNAAIANEFAIYVNYDSTLTVQNNTFPSSTAQNGTFYNMYMGQTKGVVKILNNNFDITSSGATQAANGFYTPGNAPPLQNGYQDPTGTFIFTGNTLTGSNIASTTGNLFGFYMFGIDAKFSNISNNTVSNLSWGSGTHSGNLYCLYYYSGASDSLNVIGNKFTNIRKNGTGTTGAMFGSYIYNNLAAGGKLTYENNKMRNIQANYTLWGHYVLLPTTYVQRLSSRYNTMDSVYMNSSSGYKYVYNYWNYNGINAEIAYDTVRRISTNSGYIGQYDYWSYYGTDVDVHHNYRDSIDVGGTSAVAAAYVYYTRGSAKYRDNITKNITMTGGTFYGCYMYSTDLTSPFKVYNNLVTNANKTGAGASNHWGLYIGGTGDAEIYNNSITNLNMNNLYTGGGANLVGLYLINSSGTNRVYNNTIHIATVGSPTTFSATGIYFPNNVLNLDLRNNLVHVNCTPGASGSVVALRRASGTAGVAPANLNSNTGNNIYYTPNIANSFWYAEGTTSTALTNTYGLVNDPNINNSCGSTYKAFMNPRENGTFVENNISPVAGAPGFYAPSGSSFAKKGGVKVTGFPATNTDQLGVARPANPDIGALQFTGTLNDVAGPKIIYTQQPTNSYCLTPQNITAAITDASGVDQATGTAPRLYYRKTTDANAFGVANTSAGNGWKWVQGTVTIGDTFSFAFDYTKLQSPPVAGNALVYFVVAQDNSATPNVSYTTAGFPAASCPASVAITSGSTAAVPPSDTLKLINPTGFTAVPDYSTHCNTGSSILTITPAPLGTTVVWEQSSNGTTFTTIAGATAFVYTTPLISTTTYYRAKVYCDGSTLIGTTPTQTITVASPLLINSSLTADRCGEGTVSLTATAGSGSSIGWYKDSTSRIPIATGGTFTPYVKDSVKYYVAAFSQNAAREITTGTPAGASNYTYNDYGVAFSIKQVTNITRTTVYATGTGALVVGLYDSLGTTLIATNGPFQINGGGSAPGTPVNIPLNFLNLSPGQYVLRPATGTASTTSLLYQSVSGIFPITSPSGNLAITTGYSYGLSSGYYGYFYNIESSTDCISAKVPVKVNVRPAPAIKATSAKQPGLCLGQTDTVSVSTLNPNYTFAWSTGQTTSSFAVTPTSDATYIVTATDQAGGAFNNCVRKDTVNIPVSLPPTAPTISPLASTICAGSVSVLNATPGLLGGGGGNAGPYTIGTGTLTNTTTSTPAVYGRYYTGSRTQMLVRASELTATGMLPGKIKSLAFDVTGLNTFDNAQGFTIGLLATTAMQVSTSALVNGATQVFTKASETPVTGWNTYNFTTPFIWDGTSNILVDVYFTNCTSCSGSSFTCSGTGFTQNASQNQSATSFVSTAFYRADGTSCNIGANTAISGTDSKRPNMRFTAEPPVNVNWIPVAGLYRDTLLTQAMIPVDSNFKAFASPNTTTTYTAVSNYRGCKSGPSNASVVTVTPTPTVTTTVSPSRRVCTGQTVNIAIPNGGAGITYQWYNGATPIGSATSNSFVATTSGAYSVLATNTASGCSRRSVVENILVSPYPTATVTATTANPTCAPNTITLAANAGPKLVYQWLKGGVNVASATMMTYIVDSTNAYSVIVTDTATTCSSTSTALVATVNRTDKTLSLSGATAICAGNTVTISVPNNANQTYVWKRGNTVIAGATSNSYVADTTGNFRVVITNTVTGCRDSSAVTPVIVGPAPVSDITPAVSAFVCAGDSVRLVTNKSPNLSYTWYRNGSVIANATDSVYYTSIAGNYKVRVASDPLCASTTATATAVTVNPLPAATVTSATATTFCSGGSVTLNANAGSGFTYQWQNNGTAINGATGINYLASNAGTYSVRVSDGNNCSKISAPSVVTVNPLPPAVVTVGNTTVCSGSSVVISANTGAGLIYQWKESNVNIPGANNSTFNAGVSGIYTVKVTNSFGCSDTSVATVATVNARPSAVITPGPTANVCIGSSLTLRGPVPANSYYQWLLNGNPILGATQDQYTTTTAGSYRLRVINSLTGCRDSSTTVVTAVAPPVVVVTPAAGSASPICSNDSITLNASGSGLTYQWSKNGVAIPGAAAKSNSFKISGGLGSGAYTVTATNSAGCTGTSAAFNLVVNPAPDAFVTYNSPLEFCRGGAVVLNAQAPGNAVVSWIINGVQQPADPNRFRSAINSGNYSIRVVAPGGCIAVSNVVTVKVNELPSPVITRSWDTLFAGPGSYLTYQWLRNNLPINGANDNFYKVKSNAGYAVRVSDAKGCENVSETYLFSNVGINSVAGKGLIRLYPNPTTGLVKVECPVGVDITVRDATGRVVRVVNAASEVNFGDLADGLYMVYLTDVNSKELLHTEKITKVSR